MQSQSRRAAGGSVTGGPPHPLRCCTMLECRVPSGGKASRMRVDTGTSVPGEVYTPS